MLRVKDIMTKRVTTVKPKMSVKALAKLLIRKNISGAPVIDAKGKLLGVAREEGVIFQNKKVHLPTFISISMGFFALDTERFNDDIKKITATRVCDLMEKKVIKLSPEMTVNEAATLMLEEKNCYCPVLKGKKLVGVE